MSRAVLALLAACLVTGAVFSLWPSLDLTVSAQLYDRVRGTWAAEAPALAALRDILWTAGEGFVLVFAALFLLALARRGRAAVPARLWGFGFLALALGPGVLVNLILKDHWGRARPRMVTDFGGEAAFTPVLQVADQCARNCSFVSGEVAMTATVSLVLWLMLAGRLGRRARGLLGGALVAATGLSAFLRVAGGGHFLSDAIYAVLLPSLLTLALWRLTGAAGAAPCLTWRAIRADLSAPLAALKPRN